MIRLSLLLVLLPLCAMAPVAHAQSPRLNRCTDVQGQSVYTDRPCDSVGARSRLPPPAPTGNTAPRDTLGARCPRRLSELVDALRNGILSNDVNRLSSLYLWGAVSDAGRSASLANWNRWHGGRWWTWCRCIRGRTRSQCRRRVRALLRRGPTLSRRPRGIRSACAWSRRCRAALRAPRRCWDCGGSTGVSGSRCDREGRIPFQWKGL